MSNQVDLYLALAMDMLTDEVHKLATYCLKTGKSKSPYVSLKVAELRGFLKGIAEGAGTSCELKELAAHNLGDTPVDFSIDPPFLLQFRHGLWVCEEKEADHGEEIFFHGMTANSVAEDLADYVGMVWKECVNADPATLTPSAANFVEHLKSRYFPILATTHEEANEEARP